MEGHGRHRLQENRSPPQFCNASENKTHSEAFEITRSVRLESPFFSVYALTLGPFLTSVEETRKDQSSAE